MSLVWAAIRRREDGSVVSAVRMGIEGGGFGWVAQERAWLIFDSFLPAKARFFNGEQGVLRNLRASLITYLPVKPDAPKIIMS